VSQVAVWREIVLDTLRSGLSTRSMLESDAPALRVSWIASDSGFRDSGLRVGDQIVGVEGSALVRPADTSALQRAIRELPGGLNESDTFKGRGLADGSPLRLSVRRRRYPGEGWQIVDVIGQVRAERVYSGDNARRAMGPTGPDALATDGFDGPWSSWYEKRIFDWERVLDGGWQGKLNTRRALADHLEHSARVEFLGGTYPGPFADAVRADWDAVRSSLEGTRYTLPPDALDFRQVEEERTAAVARNAAEAWKAYLAAHDSELLHEIPSVDPLRGDRGTVSGKLVLLPAIPPTQWVVSVDRNFLSSEQNRTWFFVPSDAPGMRRAFLAQQRYKRLVTPRIRDTYAVIGRVLPDPRMVVIGGRGVAGFEVEPMAVLVDNAMFVDVSVIRNEESPFAGEDDIKRPRAALPADEATPREVLEAMVAAVKAGDQSIWNQLFAVWRFIPDDQRPIYYPFDPYTTGTRDEDWVRSQRRMLETVCDVRVVWVDDARVVQKGDEYPGAPRIEQAGAELEHIGDFDGEFDAFNGSEVNRLWTLQRRNGGPWRITSRQSI
jgi:hypothetical protein